VDYLNNCADVRAYHGFCPLSEERFDSLKLIAPLSRLIDRGARQFGYRFLPKSFLDLYQVDVDEPSGKSGDDSPADAAVYLQRDNPRLLELGRLYAGLDETLKTPLVWTDEYAAQTDLQHFRGHSAWVYQKGNLNLGERAHLLAAYFVLAHDELKLFEGLSEDGLFGAITYTAAGHKVSRDLLDSILEIGFLDRHLQIASRSGLKVLDIGAGYGRLADRMLSAFPLLSRYFCADAIPESSFVCEYYLQFRGHQGRFKVIPATEIDELLAAENVELAINIHSFSECTLNAVKWWLDKLVAHRVKHFMIVPNACNHDGRMLWNNAGEDMQPLIEQCGYRLVAREPKYSDPGIQKFGLNPTWFWLFGLAI